MNFNEADDLETDERVMKMKHQWNSNNNSNNNFYEDNLHSDKNPQKISNGNYAFDPSKNK